MPLNYQQMIVQDFSGGITDRYINADTNSYRYADNFLITEYGTLELRPGSMPVYQSESFEHIMGLFELNEEVFVFRGAQMYSFNETTSSLEIAPLPNGGAYLQTYGPDMFPHYVEWRNQLHVNNSGQVAPLVYNRPMKTWRNEFGTMKSSELGLPKYIATTDVVAVPSLIATTPTPPSIDDGLADRSYLYSAIFTVEYQVGDVKFQNVSTVWQSDAIQFDGGQAVGESGDTGPETVIELTGFPNVSTFQNQLDVGNIKIELYRTTDGGTVSYYVRDIDLGFGGTITDDATDEEIRVNKTLYTTGGLVEHYQAPKCKSMTAVNDIFYFGGVLEELETTDDQLRPYRIMQSIPGVPGAVDPTYYTDLDDDVVGLNHFKGIPLAFTSSYIYRIEGQIDATGSGNIRPRSISSDAGCLSHNGIIRTDFGCFWAGSNGFYKTDGFNIELLTDKLSKRYTQYSDKFDKIKRVSGTYDKENERIYWATSDDGVTNNKLWIFDIRTGKFTTASGQQMVATSLHYNKNRILRGDDYGYIYEHKIDYTADRDRDINKSIDTWAKLAIIPYFESVAYDMGNAHTRKWVQQATFSISTGSDASIAPYSNNDDSRSVKAMKEIGIRGFITWGDENFVWGNPDTLWRPAETTVYQRHFPRGAMRCRRKQVKLTTNRIILFRSDIFGECVIAPEDPAEQNPTRFTATLSGLDRWPTDIVNEKISFDHDDYLRKLVVRSRSDQTIIITGSLGSGAPGTSKRWHIEGYQKDQRWELKGISFTFAPLDNQGNKFDQADAKDNA